MAAPSNSILVTNLPITTAVSLPDKLEIHFGKRSNGGGDVERIQVAVNGLQTGASAVITFAEEETVHSVLRKQHIFLGQRLIVKPHQLMNTDVVNTALAVKTDDSSETGDELSNDCTFTASSENVDDVRDGVDSEPLIKLILEGHSSDALLEAAAAFPTTKVQIDDKTARYTLTGPANHVMQAAVKLLRNSSCVDTDGCDDKQETGSPLAETFEKVHPENGPLIKDETSSTHVEKSLPMETDENKKRRPKRSQIHQSVTKLKPRNTVKFDQKILDYLNMNIVCHQVINALRDQFMVSFETKPAGTISVNSKSPEVNQQNITSAIEALEDLVNQIKESGLVTEIFDLRELPEASQNVKDAAVKQATESTQVLVTHKTQDKLEFFGTELGVYEEIEKLQRALLDRQSPDELSTDDDSKQETNNRLKPNFNGEKGHGAQTSLGETASAVSQEQFDDQIALFAANLKSTTGACSSDLQAKSVISNAMSKPEETSSALVRPEERDSMHTLRHFIEKGQNSFEHHEERKSNKASPSVIPIETSCNTSVCRDDESHGLVRQDEQVSLYTYIAPDEMDSAVPKNTKDTQIPQDVFRFMRIRTKDNFLEKSSPSLPETTQDAARKMDTATYNPRPRRYDTLESLFSLEGHSHGRLSPAQRSYSSQPPFINGSVGDCPEWGHSSDFSITMKTGMTVIIRQGDLTDEFTDVIVSVADPHLRLHQGVGRAVRDAAGPELVAACQRWIQKHGPVKPGQNVWTTGGHLKCSHVLHVVPPRKSNGKMKSTLETLKEMFVDILKTCTHSLEASAVSMPAIGSGMFASRQLCANAFFDAVLEINQLYWQGFLRLDTLILVDRDPATVEACMQAFNDAILSGLLLELCQWEGSGPGTASGTSECADNAYINEVAMACRPHMRPVHPHGSPGNPRQKHRGRFARGNSSHHHQPEDRLGRPDSEEEGGRLSPQPENMCTVCLGEIKNEKKLRCGHRFCCECLNLALAVHKYCPFCKQPVNGIALSNYLVNVSE